jgi:hypothetical protein
MKVIAAVLVAIGCAILIGLLAFMGFEVSKLTRLGPCMGEASSSVAELARLPEIFKKKMAEAQEEINALPAQTLNKTSEIQAKLQADPGNSTLMAQLSGLPQEEQQKFMNLTTQMNTMDESMRNETCRIGKKIPAQFIGCASNVENNVLFKSFAPSGMHKTDDITAFVKKTMSDAGCANTTNSSETTEEQASSGSSGFPGWAVYVLALLALLLLIAGCALCCIGDGESENDEEQGYAYVDNREDDE